MSRLRSWSLLAGILAVGLATPAARGDEVTLRGGPLPALVFTDAMLQGPPVRPDEFAGKVVYFELFQLGCPGCTEHSMPFLQRMFRTYRFEPDVLVFAVHSAYERAQDPRKGDLRRVRDYLASRGYCMPVAIDRDEVSITGFRRSAPHGAVGYGTPMGIVVDHHSVVLAHEWTGGPGPIAEIEAALARATNDLRGASLPVLDSRLAEAIAAYRALRLGDAWRLAGDLEGALPEDTQALRTAIERQLQRRFALVAEHFDEDPIRGLAWAEALIARSAGVAGGENRARSTEAWRSSARLAQVRGLEAALDKLRARLDQRDFLEVLQARAELSSLRSLAQEAGPTPVADASLAIASRIEAALEGPGFPGFSLPETGALVVNAVLPDGPAARAGVRVGDRLATWNGAPLSDLASLVATWQNTRPGQEVELGLARAGQSVALRVRLALAWER